MIFALPYFQRPYSDSTNASILTRLINGKNYTIYRPNHGLVHSLRQGFLVQDIVSLMKLTNGPMGFWINSKLNSDPNFIIKLAILSSFQRSGQQSEVSSEENLMLYSKYEINDVNNMIYTMSQTPNPYFNKDEVLYWANCLRWNNHTNISNLIKSAHLLDLRRIPNFDHNMIRSQVSKLLGLNPTSNIMNKLWDQSGVYLNVSGDRDLAISKTNWSNRFFILQQDPMVLYMQLKKKLIKEPCSGITANMYHNHSGNNCPGTKNSDM